MHPGRADQLVDGDAHGDGAALAHRLLGVLDDLAQQAHPVDQAAAIFVAAGVVAPRQEMLQRPEAMGGIDIDDVEAGALRPLRRLAMPAPQIGDILLVHGAGLDRVGGEGGNGQMRGSHGDLAAVEVRPVHAVIGELDPRQRVMAMDRLAHAGEAGDILIVPEAQLDEGRDLRGRMDFHLLGADHPPAALGLDLAEPGERTQVPIPHAGAMGHLVETVLGCMGADPDGLEEDVVARVAGHDMPCCSPPAEAGRPDGIFAPCPLARQARPSLPRRRVEFSLVKNTLTLGGDP